MSNIYIQEPPTEGKVLLETTVGDIDIELWSRECPKACRNFIQLCMEGYYDKCVFHRLVKGFIVQGGDPTGTGTGGTSIWGKPFKDELHSRLRFARRGLVAMANAGKDDNGSQFFFTLGETKELQNKHTLFGKVGGNTIYNMLKLEEGDVDIEERPLYPHKIIRTKVLNNPFPDIVPRESVKSLSKEERRAKKNKSTASAVKNYGLLSFGNEAEEEEEEISELSKKFSTKGKSSHDLLTNDPKLSSQLACDPTTSTASKDKDKDAKPPSDKMTDSDDDDDKEMKSPPRAADDKDDNPEDGGSDRAYLDLVKDKLKKKDERQEKIISKKSSKSIPAVLLDEDVDKDVEQYYLGKDDKDAEKKRLDKIRKEYKELKRSMKPKPVELDEDDDEKKKESEIENSAIKSYMEEQKAYRSKKADVKKGDDREAQTLALLNKFKSKITSAINTYGEDGEETLPPIDDKDEEPTIDPMDTTWLARSLHCDPAEQLVLAKDANKKSDDWYEIYDPKNPLNRRRREESQRAQTEKWKKSKVID